LPFAVIAERSSLHAKALALLATAAIIAVVAFVALYGNHQPAVIQLVRSCEERLCGEYALLDCESAGGGPLYVYARVTGRFLADCETSNAAKLSGQPLCSKIFEAMKSCPAK
jgi:hypothetical protein